MLMIKLSLAFSVIAFGLSGSVVACERHGEHATLIAAATTPAPESAPAVLEPVVLQSTPAIEEPMAVATPVDEYAQGGGCARGRKKEQTVILTD
jgi:hypothetical protein